MNQKWKWIAGCAGLVVLIGGAGLLYRNLADQYKPNSLAPVVSQTEPSAASSSSAGQSAGAAEESSAVTSSASGSQSSSAQSSAPEKVAAPDFSMEDADGNIVKLSDFKGKPVVVNFWATWCGYCAVEMPDFNEMNEEMDGAVQFIMLDVVDGVRETKEKGMAYIAEKGYTFPVYYDTAMEGGTVYGVRNLPTTYFIDKNGDLVTYAAGALDKETLKKGIDMAIEQGK